MNGLIQIYSTPIKNTDGRWEVVLEKNDTTEIKVDNVVQTDTFAFYVDSITPLKDGGRLVLLTPKG